MKGKNGTTSFLPERRKGGKVRFSEEVTYIPNKERTCLTKDQATQIYDEIEKDEPINIQILFRELVMKRKQRKCNKKRRTMIRLKTPIRRPLQI